MFLGLELREQQRSFGRMLMIKYLDEKKRPIVTS